MIWFLGSGFGTEGRDRGRVSRRESMPIFDIEVGVRSKDRGSGSGLWIRVRVGFSARVRVRVRFWDRSRY